MELDEDMQYLLLIVRFIHHVCVQVAQAPKVRMNKVQGIMELDEDMQYMLLIVCFLHTMHVCR